MLHLDADELYDLSEAGRMLRADPVRIRRWARQGRVPAIRLGGNLVLPRAWVDAASGRSASDAESLRRYWLDRLAPPAPEARRAMRDRARLPASGLLGARDAAHRILADEARLRRMDADGTLPALSLDGERRYDEDLVSLLAREGLDDEAARTTDARREEVRDWARFEYVTDLDAGATAPPTQARAAPAEAVAVAPHAWHLPEEIAAVEGPPPDEDTQTTDTPGEGARLIRAEGFEVEDEDA